MRSIPASVHFAGCRCGKTSFDAKTVSDSYEDYREEQYLDELYQEVSAEAIEKFQADRLRSFYLANPLIAVKPFESLGEAK
jgi:hypothetical protein